MQKETITINLKKVKTKREKKTKKKDEEGGIKREKRKKKKMKRGIMESKHGKRKSCGIKSVRITWMSNKEEGGNKLQRTLLLKV